MALNGLSANADSVASQRNGATVGSLFNDMAQAYLYNQQQAGRNSVAGMVPGANQDYGVSSVRKEYKGS